MVFTGQLRFRPARIDEAIRRHIPPGRLVQTSSTFEKRRERPCIFQPLGRGLKLSARFATVWASASNALKMRPPRPPSGAAIAVRHAARSAICEASRRREYRISSKSDLLISGGALLIARLDPRGKLQRFRCSRVHFLSLRLARTCRLTPPISFFDWPQAAGGWLRRRADCSLNFS